MFLLTKYLAMSTPRGEELNKPHVVRLQDQLLEVALRQFDDLVPTSALATASATSSA